MSVLQGLNWYHGNMSRHVAEALLIANGVEGSYLLRDGSQANILCVSVRLKDSVNHFKIEKLGDVYKFGITEFNTANSLVTHFANQPLLGGSSGTMVLLKHPYPKVVEEPDNYETIVLHSTAHSGATEKDLQFLTQAKSLASKEGFLTKLGFIRKNWKTRWFVLVKYELSYYADRSKEKPIKTLDLTDCQGCAKDDSLGKEFCFKLEFPDRTWYFYANSEEEQKEWMDMIVWKLKKLKKEKLGY